MTDALRKQSDTLAKLVSATEKIPFLVDFIRAHERQLDRIAVRLQSMDSAMRDVSGSVVSLSTKFNESQQSRRGHTKGDMDQTSDEGLNHDPCGRNLAGSAAEHDEDIAKPGYAKNEDSSQRQEPEIPVSDAETPIQTPRQIGRPGHGERTKRVLIHSPGNTDEIEVSQTPALGLARTASRGKRQPRSILKKAKGRSATGGEVNLMEGRYRFRKSTSRENKGPMEPLAEIPPSQAPQERRSNGGPEATGDGKENQQSGEILSRGHSWYLK